MVKKSRSNRLKKEATGIGKYKRKNLKKFNILVKDNVMALRS
jgi:hypothetical protein